MAETLRGENRIPPLFIIQERSGTSGLKQLLAKGEDIVKGVELEAQFLCCFTCTPCGEPVPFRLPPKWVPMLPGFMKGVLSVVKVCSTTSLVHPSQ